MRARTGCLIYMSALCSIKRSLRNKLLQPLTALIRACLALPWPGPTPKSSRSFQGNIHSKRPEPHLDIVIVVPVDSLSRHGAHSACPQHPRVPIITSTSIQSGSYQSDQGIPQTVSHILLPAAQFSLWPISSSTTVFLSCPGPRASAHQAARYPSPRRHTPSHRLFQTSFPISSNTSHSALPFRLSLLPSSRLLH